MRAANVTASVAVISWLAFAFLGRDFLSGVIGQRVSGYPNMVQINFYVVWPMFVVVSVLTCAWVCNLYRRWFAALGALAGASLLALFPYLMFSGGGV